jgi:F0F1-type ATP synthase epsilon subunit
MNTIKVDIVSAEGEIHSGTARMVYAPAKMGEVGIAPRVFDRHVQFPCIGQRCH